MFLVIRFEIVIHMVDITSHFWAQQHPCLQITLLLIRHSSSIHSRERECGIRKSLNVQCHLSTGFQPCRFGLKGNAVFLWWFGIDKEQSIGQHLSVTIEYRHLVHTFFHLFTVQFQFHQWSSHQSVTMVNVTIIHQHITNQFTTYSTWRLQSGQHIIIHHIQRQCTAFTTCSRQGVDLFPTLRIHHLHRQFRRIRNDSEIATT